MIIAESEDNIFDTEMQSLVCPVNTEGTLGKGLAEQFKHMFPRLLRPYQQACLHGTFRRQHLYVFDDKSGKKVICMPTKRKWRNPSQLAWILQSLERLASDYADYGITSIAIPAVGCGLGQLKWKEVYPAIRYYLHPLPIPVTVYLP